MRITTSAVLRNYQTGLSKATIQLNSDQSKVLSQRAFSKSAEDPAAAAQAFKLRKSYASTCDYISNAKGAISKLDTVESSAVEMNTVAQSAKELILQGINGATSSEGRATIAASLRAYQETLVLGANAKYGDDFIYGGANTSEVPFELVNGKLQYYGIDVNTTDTAEKATLNKLASEEILTDIGFGLEVDGSSSVTSGTAFSISFSGLDALGYGKDTDGNEANLVNLLGKIADELEADNFDTAETSKLSKQFDSACAKLLNYVTGLGTKSNYLQTTLTRLEDNKSIITDKISSLESVDMAEAITNYSWSQYAYNAALKVGNSILSQSFIDYMS